MSEKVLGASTLYNAEVCGVTDNNIQLHLAQTLTVPTSICLNEVSPPINLLPRRAAHKVTVWQSLHLFYIIPPLFCLLTQSLTHHNLSMLLQQNILTEFPILVPHQRVILIHIFEQWPRTKRQWARFHIVVFNSSLDRWGENRFWRLLWSYNNCTCDFEHLGFCTRLLVMSLQC